jgi:KEOPS complex subunit Pcc1
MIGEQRMGILEAVVCEFEIEFESLDDARQVFRSIEPEIRTSPPRRSQVQANLKQHILTLKVDAEDTSSLRASLNSYLRWINLSYDILKFKDD